MSRMGKAAPGRREDAEARGPDGRRARDGEDHRGELPTTVIEDIYRRYRAYVWTKLRRADVDPEAAEGIHQEAFLVLDREIQRKGVPDNVASMLAVIAGHLICNHLRARQRRPQAAGGVEVDAVPSGEPDPERRIALSERKRIVAAILARMPADAAMLIRLIDLAEMTHDEVAEILGRPAVTVRVQHHRARARFRILAEKLYPTDLQGCRMTDDDERWVNLNGPEPPRVRELMDAGRAVVDLTRKEVARMERSFLEALAVQRRGGDSTRSGEDPDGDTREGVRAAPRDSQRLRQLKQALEAAHSVTPLDQKRTQRLYACSSMGPSALHTRRLEPRGWISSGRAYQRLLAGSLARRIAGEVLIEFAQIHPSRLIDAPRLACRHRRSSVRHGREARPQREQLRINHPPDSLPSTSGNQGVSPGAKAGVDSALTNIVASLRPTRCTLPKCSTRSTARIIGELVSRRTPESTSCRPSFLQMRSHADTGSMPISPVRLKTAVAILTGHPTPGCLAQSTTPPFFETLQRSSKAGDRSHDAERLYVPIETSQELEVDGQAYELARRRALPAHNDNVPLRLVHR